MIPIKPKHKMNPKRDTLHNLNHQIRSPYVRVVFENNPNLNGQENEESKAEKSRVLKLSEALKEANSKGLDLIEINPKSSPPICKIMDYGKFIYREQKSHKKDKHKKPKEIGFHVNIATHDFETKMRQAINFLKEGSPVTFKIAFRGRECAHKEIGINLFERVVQHLNANGKQDGQPKISGKLAVLRICPTKQK
jgi:translation initiation factor IF-3